MEPTPAVKSTAATVKPASSMKSSTTAMTATLGETSFRSAKKQESEVCKKNYGKHLLHFSPSNATMRGRPGRNNICAGRFLVAVQ